MRIFVVTDWNRGDGGAENYITLLRDGLRAAGDEVRLLTSSAGTAANGTADHVAFGSNRFAAQAFLQVANPFAGAVVRRVCAEMRPDIALVNMFAHHLSPSIFPALGRTPTVLLVSDYKCVCPLGSKLLPNESLCQVKAGWNCLRNGCLNPLHWLREKPRYARIAAALRRVDRVIACSESMRQELARHGISSEVMLLPSPAPSPRFDRCPSPDPLFLFCGRLDHEKGLALLFRAFARLHSEIPHARLRIVGRGPLQSRVETMIVDLRLTNVVEFCGWLPPAEIEQQLRDPWALVVPSLWAEPLGLVAIEAVTRGVPVIASAAGGLAEIVQHDASGLLFPNNDEAALLAHMRTIARAEKFPNHRLPNEIVGQAREKFEIRSHIEKMRRVFAETISECSRNGTERLDSLDRSAGDRSSFGQLCGKARRAIDQTESTTEVVGETPHDRL